MVKYDDTFTPGQATGSNKEVSAFTFKLDREQTKTGTYALNTVEQGMSVIVASTINDFTYQSQTLTAADWELGPAGIQILDYGDVVSNNVEGSSRSLLLSRLMRLELQLFLLRWVRNCFWIPRLFPSSI